MSAPDLYIPFMAACTYCVLASVAQTAGRRFKPDTLYATVRGARLAPQTCMPLRRARHPFSGTLWLEMGVTAAPALQRGHFCMTASVIVACSSAGAPYFAPVSVGQRGAHDECLPGGAQVSEASAAWLVHWVLLKGMLWVLGIPGAVPFLELAAYAGYAFVPVCISMLAGLALGAPPHHEPHSMRTTLRATQHATPQGLLIPNKTEVPRVRPRDRCFVIKCLSTQA